MHHLQHTGRLCLAAAILLSACVSPPSGPERVYQSAADALIQPWHSTDAPGVAVAVAKGGEVIYSRGAGLANLEHERAIEPGTVFQVASVSKQFTAFATLLLVAEGRIRLDDDIRAYLPELRPHETTVTVQHLLDHTGGLRESQSLLAMAGWLNDDIRTHEQTLALVARQRGVNFAAGDEVEYSNTGYALLAEIVARVAEMPFEQFMHEQLFAPLGMDQTRFIRDRGELVDGRASAYFPTTEGYGRVIDANELFGSTGLYTSAPDLLIWANHLNNRTFGPAIAHDLMDKRVRTRDGDDATFAKGQERRLYNGLVTWSHGGRDAGYRSFLLRVPEHDLALSIISNRTDFDTAALAFSLLDEFLSDAPEYAMSGKENWSPATPGQLHQYAGVYEIQPGVLMSFEVHHGALSFSMLGDESGTPLQQIGARQFMLNPASDISVRFAEPERKFSPSLEYVIGLHGTIEAPRRTLNPFDAGAVDLSEMAGYYWSDELQTMYRLSAENGRLLAHHPRRPPFELTPYQTDLLRATSGPLQRVQVQRDKSGQIRGFLASAPLAKNVEFVRVPDLALMPRDSRDNPAPPEAALILSPGAENAGR